MRCPAGMAALVPLSRFDGAATCSRMGCSLMPRSGYAGRVLARTRAACRLSIIPRATACRCCAEGGCPRHVTGLRPPRSPQRPCAPRPALRNRPAAAPGPGCGGRSARGEIPRRRVGLIAARWDVLQVANLPSLPTGTVWQGAVVAFQCYGLFCCGEVLGKRQLIGTEQAAPLLLALPRLAPAGAGRADARCGVRRLPGQGSWARPPLSAGVSVLLRRRGHAWLCR